MRLLEYEAKEILGDFDFLVPPGAVIRTPQALEASLQQFGPRVAVKAQVRQDGRGKAGGVVLADSPADARDAVKRLLNQPFRGEPVRSVLVEERLDVTAELYIGITTDRERGCPTAIVGSAGGVEIEREAADRPQTLARAAVDIAYGLGEYQARYLVRRAGIAEDVAPQVSQALSDLYRLYRRCDAIFVEVNPLVVTSQDQLVAVDARLDVDDNALFRQPRFRDIRELTPLEAKVEKAGFHYVETDGDVGIISTGSGACMAIMDMLAAHGGRPANFMELGQSMGTGGAEVATEILLARRAVAAILVAGFSGGPLDRMVQGVLTTLGQRADRQIPVVISVQGRNEEGAMAAAESSDDPRVRAIHGVPEAVRAVAALARSDHGDAR